MKVFPARAGMSRLYRNSVTSRIRVPRASGDEPPEQPEEDKPEECSPCERG